MDATEAHWSQIFNAMAEGVIILDENGRIEMCNSPAERILGLTAEEMSGISSMDPRWRTIHEDGSPFPGENHPAMITLRTGQSITGVIMGLPKPDGAITWISISSHAIFRNGKPRAVFTIFSDVSERKAAEQALRHRNRYIETILEEAPIGFAVHTIDDGVGRFVSARFEEIYGVPRGTIDSHHTFFEKVWPRDPELREQIRRRVLADMTSGDPSRMHWDNIPIPTADGATRYIDAMNIPVPEQNLMVSTVQDVTEHVRAQKALRDSEEQLRHAAVAAEFGTFSYDFVSGQIFHSPEHLALYGLPPGAWLPMDEHLVPEAVDPNDKASFLAHMMARAYPCGSGILDFEHRIIRADGQNRWLRVRGKTVFSDDGRPLRSDGIVQDVTERKRAETEALVLREELAHFSCVATVGELTASIAHELAQPLAAILANTQTAWRLMQSETPDLNEMREILADIAADDQRATEVIRSLRSMLKGGGGERSSLLLNDLITDILSIVRNDGRERKVAIILDLDSPMPPIVGDRVQLQQVILNLIVNAFEAMDKSEGSRELRLRTSKIGNEVILDVMDSGCGIPPEKLDTVFEPFFTTKPTGLGMGLSLSRSIVKSHNGRLYAENNSERGATFHMSLPLEELSQPIPEEA
jgi:PAS domain S-box-containing protein